MVNLNEWVTMSLHRCGGRPCFFLVPTRIFNMLVFLVWREECDIP